MSIATGDVDGDGVAEILVPSDRRSLLLMTSTGQVLHRWPYQFQDFPGHILADLDADGEYEIAVLDADGFRIYDGQTYETLAEDLTIHNGGFAEPDRLSGGFYNPIIAADVDNDNSMELIVGGRNESGDMVIRVYGPATGRWARGRPIWNQYAYDITSVYDDGSLVPYPIPGWKAYNAYRAQPAHDGKRPDLQPTLLAACVPDCTQGEIQLVVGVQNTGSAEADVVTVRLHTFLAGRWQMVAERQVGRIAAMDSQSVALAVDATLWGERQVLEVEGDEEECDRVNDRVEITFDLCDPPEELFP